LVWSGTFAETVMVDARACAAKPAHWSYAQAAAVALALLCADLALERAQVHAGQQILIHGAGGSVGAAAVLLARQRGASVHATGSLDDKSFTEQLGAQAFYDYRQTPLQQLPRGKYDMVLDGMGERMFLDSLPLLKKGGAIASLKVMTGMDDMLKMGMKPPGIFKYLLPFIMRKYTGAAKSAGVRVVGVATYQNGARLAELGAQAAALGYLPRIDRSFAFSQAPAALEYFAKGKPRGKVVVEI
jgi:NADPH:quinone reductase-like Zn-dependent oxidoreductase